MKNVFVYDRRNYFLLFLKRTFSKEYNFIRLNDVDSMKIEKYKTNDVGVFVVNNDNDIVAFFRFRDCFKDRILVCSDNKRLSQEYNKFFKLNCLDITSPKKSYYGKLYFKIQDLFKI